MNKVERLALYSFYPIMFLVYFLIMFGVNINSYIGLPILLVIVLFSLQHIFCDRGGINTAITIWLFYNLLSIVLYAENGRPIDCYVGYLRQFIFPMLFFYFGKIKDYNYNQFYKIFGYSCIFCLGLGLVFYITTPDFYVTYLNEARHAKWFDNSIHVNESNLMSYTRFSAFWSSSYAVSYLGIPALCFSFLLLDRDRDSFNLWFALLLISTISLILCMQRIAMAFVVLYLVYIPFSGKIKNKKMFIWLAILFVVGVFGVPLLLELFDNRFSIITEQLFGRIDAFSFSKAMSEERSSQYDLVLKYWERPILGLGLGAASSIALSFGFPGVTDGEYIRILAESGLVGFCIFLYIVVRTLSRGVVFRNRVWAELLVVIYFLAACIGSNALSIMHLFAPMFWFCIGRIWNVDYYNNSKNNK